MSRKTSARRVRSETRDGNRETGSRLASGSRRRKRETAGGQRERVADKTDGRTWLRPACAALVASVLVFSGSWFLWDYQVSRSWRARLPQVPELDGFPARMRDDIERADRDARTGTLSGATVGRLGQVYHANLWYPEAIACYALAEELDASDYRWPYYRGILDAEVSENEEALSHFERVLAHRPDDACVWLRVGDVYFKTQDYAQASEAYRRALSAPACRSHALLGLARVSERKNDWQRVVELLEQSVLHGASLGPAFRLLMSAYRELGRSGDVDRLTRLGEYYGVGNAGLIDDPLVRELEDLSSSSTYLLKQASLAQAAKDEQRRLRILSRAVRVAPDDPHVQIAMCECYQEAAGTCFGDGRPDDARRLLAESLPHAQSAARLRPDWARGHMLCGVALEHTGLIDQAVEHYRQAVELSPSLEEPHFLLGKALSTAGRLDEAVEVCRRAVELNANSFQAWYVLGKTLAQAGRGDEALEALQAARQIMPLSPFPDYETAKVFVAQGRSDEAKALLREVVARCPESLESRELLRGLETGQVSTEPLSKKSIHP